MANSLSTLPSYRLFQATENDKYIFVGGFDYVYKIDRETDKIMAKFPLDFSLSPDQISYRNAFPKTLWNNQFAVSSLLVVDNFLLVGVEIFDATLKSYLFTLDIETFEKVSHYFFDHPFSIPDDVEYIERIDSSTMHKGSLYALRRWNLVLDEDKSSGCSLISFPSLDLKELSIIAQTETDKVILKASSDFILVGHENSVLLFQSNVSPRFTFDSNVKNIFPLTEEKILVSTYDKVYQIKIRGDIQISNLKPFDEIYRLQDLLLLKKGENLTLTDLEGEIYTQSAFRKKEILLFSKKEKALYIHGERVFKRHLEDFFLRPTTKNILKLLLQRYKKGEDAGRLGELNPDLLAKVLNHILPSSILSL